mmetsp:Transcript_9745/g.24934  ORF Transcript_9745/g.24934 Transcript_9745/m.24934 type:complete len:297 (-) Transcript_9745:1036-1926(-)
MPGRALLQVGQRGLGRLQARAHVCKVGLLPSGQPGGHGGRRDALPHGVQVPQGALQHGTQHLRVLRSGHLVCIPSPACPPGARRREELRWSHVRGDHGRQHDRLTQVRAVRTAAQDLWANLHHEVLKAELHVSQGGEGHVLVQLRVLRLLLLGLAGCHEVLGGGAPEDLETGERAIVVVLTFVVRKQSNLQKPHPTRGPGHASAARPQVKKLMRPHRVALQHTEHQPVVCGVAVAPQDLEMPEAGGEKLQVDQPHLLHEQLLRKSDHPPPCGRVARGQHVGLRAGVCDGLHLVDPF